MKRNNNFMASRGSLFVAAEATFAAMEEKERKMKERGKLVYAAYMLKKWAETSALKDISLIHFWVLQFDAYCVSSHRFSLRCFH